jgi:NADPH2:quinone reductase
VASDGRRVAATVPFGAFAERAVAPEFVVFELPDAMSYPEAAAMVVNHQTAHLALTRRGRLAPGETVLVHGAAGGVGLAAIGVAKALGAGKIVAIASSDAKRTLALEAGATEALDSEDDWVTAMRDDGGADVVVDPVGGDAFDGSVRCMAPEGRILVVGFASGRIPELAVNRLLLRHVDVVGVNFGGMLPFDQAFPAAAWADLRGWWEQGLCRPAGVSEHALEDGPAVLRALGERRMAGKPVLRLRQE